MYCAVAVVTLNYSLTFKHSTREPNSSDKNVHHLLPLPPMNLISFALVWYCTSAKEFHSPPSPIENSQVELKYSIVALCAPPPIYYIICICRAFNTILKTVLNNNLTRDVLYLTYIVETTHFILIKSYFVC